MNEDDKLVADYYWRELDDFEVRELLTPYLSVSMWTVKFVGVSEPEEKKGFEFL